MGTSGEPQLQVNELNVFVAGELRRIEHEAAIGKPQNMIRLYAIRRRRINMLRKTEG
jgi:hypothetical protein